MTADIVNIVYTGKGDNGVLDRQAVALSEALQCPYNRDPVKGVACNHFICYVEYGEKYSDWHQTPVSAWFTHHETNVPFKDFWWKLAAAQVDLRITAARLYADRLAEYGLTRQARAAIDPQFKPVKFDKRRERPRVGVAGFVHPGGRKGEKLLARLAGSKFAESIELVGSGAGWPVPCQTYTWEELPGYYSSLAVFLCTSTIEGVPMPPLEALACGVPVVVPREVGMLDELPDLPGIVRYTAGDYVGMEAAVREALAEQYDKDALRAAVAPYNAVERAREHREAFAELKLHRAAGIESDRHGKRGALWVAYGGPSRDCAKASIATFREHMPGIEVATIASEPLGCEDVFIPHGDDDIGGRSAKTLIYDLAPADWQYILYLDADTQIVANIGFLYECLIDGWDMVICRNPAKYHLAGEMRRSDNHDETDYTLEYIGCSELLQLNGGVFAFQRNDRTGAFFRQWHSEWQRWGKRDQGALLRALHDHPMKMYVLGNEWNTIIREGYPPGKEGSAGIWHFPMSARRWRGKVPERSDSPAAWAAVKEWERQNRK